VTHAQRADGGAEPAAISLRGLQRRMGSDMVLTGVDLDVTAGRVVVLRGSNGAGKTTLLKVLATRLRPTFGTGAVFGNDLVTRSDAVRARVGFLGVYGGNYLMLNAREKLALASGLAAAGARDPGASAGRDPGAAADRPASIDAIIDLVGLTGAGDKLVRSYSSGMKKRLGLARMALLDPDLWLLDEPYAALDDDAKALVDRLVVAARSRGRTVLMASHESDRPELAPDAVLHLDGGRVRSGSAAAPGSAPAGAR